MRLADMAMWHACARADGYVPARALAVDPWSAVWLLPVGGWLAVRWAGDGITDFLRAIIETAIPARLQYLDAQNFEMYLVVD